MTKSANDNMMTIDEISLAWCWPACLHGDRMQNLTMSHPSSSSSSSLPCPVPLQLRSRSFSGAAPQVWPLWPWP